MLRCSFRPLLVLASVLATTLTSSAAPAQSAVEPWAGLKTSDLDTIYVRDVNGAEMSGKLLQLNPDSLLLLVGGVERRFDLPEVSRIQKRDSLKNGTVIGAVTGIRDGRACRRNVGLSRRRTGWQLRGAPCHCACVVDRRVMPASEPGSTHSFQGARRSTNGDALQPRWHP